MDKTSILVIYTGGTIGMIKDEKSGSLIPFNFENIYEQVPILEKFDYQLDFHCFDPILDSSNISPDNWVKIVEVIETNYEEYDGFVILHGSDTMAYTASALSFMLENLNKPVIITGSQLPLGVLRTDGRDNFITAIEIAAATIDETPVVPEVCIYFENKLMRGNRTMKYNAENFNAFVSGNIPELAKVGVYIRYNHHEILKPNFKKLKVHKNLDQNIGILKIFPGITENYIRTVFSTPDLRAIIIETFGSGNAPTYPWFLKLLEETVGKGVIVLNITQCIAGTVDQGKYETSAELNSIGVVGGGDMTVEAAVTKLMYLFGRYSDRQTIIEFLQRSLRGEMTR